MPPILYSQSSLYSSVHATLLTRQRYFHGLDRNEATGPFLLHVHSGAPTGQEEASTEAPLPYSRGTFQHLFIVSFIQVSKKLLVVRTHQQIFDVILQFFLFFSGQQEE